MSFSGNPKVAVVGSGAVGIYYGAKLARQGVDVSFLMRSDYEHVKSHGLDVHSHDGNFKLDGVKTFKTTEEIGPVDLVLITLKSTDNTALDKLLPPLIRKRTYLLTLQNGLGNEDYLAERFGGDRILGGVCFVCLNRLSRGVVQNFKHGHLALGAFIEENDSSREVARAVSDLFERSEVKCSVTDNLQATLWRKLVWNVPFNGLAIAGGGIDVEKILSDHHLMVLVRRLMEDICKGAAACGVNIEDEFMDDQIAKTRVMGRYHPSSLLDFQNGKRVEVEAIWGVPLRRAWVKGMDVPYLEMLYRLLKSVCRVQSD